MATPSILGDFGYPVVAVFPLGTATGRYYVRNSGTDTGTVVTTSRAIDLKKALHETGLTTGAKPLDTTVHTRASAPPVFRSLALSIPLQLNFHDSGRQVYITVAHKTRAATSGAGSTWVTMKSDVRRYKMGTDTDAVMHTGFITSVTAMAIQRYYKANITIAFKKASSTSAKDTTTSQSPFTIWQPSVLLTGTNIPQTIVPAVV